MLYLLCALQVIDKQKLIVRMTKLLFLFRKSKKSAINLRNNFLILVSRSFVLFL